MALLSYMTRTATEARSRATAEWISDRVRAERRHRPPPGGGPRRRQLGGTQKELAGRFYRLLSGHANIGSFLHRIGTVGDDTCWLCDTGQRQTRFHLVARCPTLRGQQRVLCKRVERLCDWEEPRAREVRLLFDDVRAAPAVLTFLRDMRVGRIVPQALRRRRGVDREGERDEGGPGPP